MATTTPAWAEGMIPLGPGAYVDAAGSIHMDTTAMCAALQLPHTERNAEIVSSRRE